MHTSRRVPLRDEKGNIVRWYSVGIDIDDQKRAEEALLASEAQLADAKRELQATIDTIPAPVSQATGRTRARFREPRLAAVYRMLSGKEARAARRK